MTYLRGPWPCLGGNHVHAGAIGRGQGEETHLRVRGLDRRDDGLPAAAGQVHVQQDHIGQAFARSARSSRAARHPPRRRALDLVAEARTGPRAEQAMVVPPERPRAGHRAEESAACLLPGVAGRVHNAQLRWRSPGGAGASSRDTSVALAWTIGRSPGLRRGGSSGVHGLGQLTGPPGRIRARGPAQQRHLGSSTSAKIDTTLAPDHFTALTVASRGRHEAANSSSRSQSPTVGGLDGHPCWASTSRWMIRATCPASGRVVPATPGHRWRWRLRSSRRTADRSPALDQGERLQHRVMHPAAMSAPLLGGYGPAGGDEVASTSHHGPQHHLAIAAITSTTPPSGPQQGNALVGGHQRGQADGEQQARDQQPQPGPRSPAVLGRAQRQLGRAPC